MEILEAVVAAAVPTLGVAVAWGRVNQQLKNLNRDVESKAAREVVDVKFDSIIERLERMERKMDRNTLNGS